MFRKQPKKLVQLQSAGICGIADKSTMYIERLLPRWPPFCGATVTKMAARPKRFSPGDLTYCCGLYKLLSQIAISLFSCVLFGTEVSLIVEIRDKKEFLAIPMRSRGTASSVVVRTRK